MVIVLVPLLPRTTVKVFGEAVSVKFPNGFTVSVIVVVARRVPEVPLIVSVVVPCGVVLPAVRDRTLLEVAGFGLKEAVTPFGSLEVVSVTLPENPLLGLILGRGATSWRFVRMRMRRRCGSSRVSRRI